MSHLIDIFLQPRQVFVDLKEKPTFLVPFVFVIALTVAMTLTYFMRVDPGWFLEQSVAASGKDLSQAEAAQIRQMLPGARTMGYIGAATAPITIGLIYLLYAVYFLLAGKVAGVAVSFKHGLSLAAWSNLPAALGTVIALIGAATMSPQTSLESLMLTQLDPLIVQLQRDHPWGAFARSFSLLTFWTVFLGALGWKTWGKTGWAQAIVVSALPSVVIYGGMAVYALVASP